jgi:hypothetical protein
LVGKLLSAGATGLLDAWAQVAESAAAGPGERFVIPTLPLPWRSLDDRENVNRTLRLALAVMCDDLVPRGTAAAGSLRYFSRYACQNVLPEELREPNRNAAASEAEGLFRTDATAGPLVGWLLARLWDDPPQLITEHILSHLDEEHFRRDCAGIVDPRGILGRALCDAAETLRAADPAAAADLVKMLPEEQRPACAAFVQALQAEKSKAIDQALLEALAVGWRAGWREALERQVRSTTEAQPPPK